MGQSESVKQFIQNKCIMFSFAWFEQIQEEFKTRLLYDPEKGRIFDSLPDLDNEGNTFYNNLDIDLKSYCWNNDLYFDYSYHQFLQVELHLYNHRMKLF